MRSTMKSVLEVNKPVQTGSEIKPAEKTDQKFSQKHGSLGETDQPPKKKSRKKWNIDIIRRCLDKSQIQVTLEWEKLWIIKTNAIAPWLTHATAIERGGDIANTHSDCSPLNFAFIQQKRNCWYLNFNECTFQLHNQINIKRVYIKCIYLNTFLVFIIGQLWPPWIIGEIKFVFIFCHFLHLLMSSMHFAFHKQPSTSSDKVAMPTSSVKCWSNLLK